MFFRYFKVQPRYHARTQTSHFKSTLVAIDARYKIAGNIYRGFNKWLEILPGKDLQTKLRKSENVDFKFSASNGTAKANTVN